MRIFRLISRIVVGITFIFSGFVKGVDPLGTMYKIEDYFIAYQMDWALDFALPLAFVLVLAEFLLGAFLLLNVRIKLTTYLITAMMAFFTIVTFYDALYNPVPDCGCFGEAIKLTNWETFYKNVVLMVFTLAILFTKPSQKALSHTKPKAVAGFIIALLFFGFNWYSYQHLPPVDFRDWKVGNDMTQEGEPKYYLVYENQETGEKQKMLSDEIPWDNEEWMNTWKFAEQQIDESSVKKPHNLEIISLEDGTDMTQLLIEEAEWQFLISAYNLETADESGLRKMVVLYEKLSDEGYEFALLTSSLDETVKEFRKKYNTDIPVYLADDIELKAMIRANPGMLLLNKGVVKAKWHHNDFPDADEIIQKFK